MTAKDHLWHLIENFVSGNDKAKDFCFKFSQIYNCELDPNTLGEKDFFLLKCLDNMVERFSDCEEYLKIPELFCSEKDILRFASRIFTRKDIAKK